MTSSHAKLEPSRPFPTRQRGIRHGHRLAPSVLARPAQTIVLAGAAMARIVPQAHLAAVAEVPIAIVPFVRACAAAAAAFEVRRQRSFVEQAGWAEQGEQREQGSST